LLAAGITAPTSGEKVVLRVRCAFGASLLPILLRPQVVSRGVTCLLLSNTGVDDVGGELSDARVWCRYGRAKAARNARYKRKASRNKKKAFMYKACGTRAQARAGRIGKRWSEVLGRYSCDSSTIRVNDR
jgi:hypothetical protein